MRGKIHIIALFPGRISSGAGIRYIFAINLFDLLLHHEVGILMFTGRRALQVQVRVRFNRRLCQFSHVLNVRIEVKRAGFSSSPNKACTTFVRTFILVAFQLCFGAQPHLVLGMRWILQRLLRRERLLMHNVKQI